MIEAAILILGVIIVAGALYWAVSRLAAAFGLPAPVVVVAQVIIVLLAVLFLMQRFWPGLA